MGDTPAVPDPTDPHDPGPAGGVDVPDRLRQVIDAVSLPDDVLDTIAQTLERRAAEQGWDQPAQLWAIHPHPTAALGLGDDVVALLEMTPIPLRDGDPRIALAKIHPDELPAETFALAVNLEGWSRGPATSEMRTLYLAVADDRERVVVRHRGAEPVLYADRGTMRGVVRDLVATLIGCEPSVAHSVISTLGAIWCAAISGPDPAALVDADPLLLIDSMLQLSPRSFFTEIDARIATAVAAAARGDEWVDLALLATQRDLLDGLAMRMIAGFTGLEPGRLVAGPRAWALTVINERLPEDPLAVVAAAGAPVPFVERILRERLIALGCATPPWLEPF